MILSKSEIWKPVNGFDGLYEISSFGRVRSFAKRTSGKLLKPAVARGYQFCTLCKNGERRNARVHRMVAEAFIENPDCKKEVNHIDGNKLNNRVDNLEWVTAAENQTHARLVGLNPLTRNNSITSIAVDMLTIDGALVQTFPSLKEAERQTGVRRSGIQKCCAGRPSYKTAGGFAWRYHL